MYEFLEETVEAVMTRPCKNVVPELTVGDLHRLFEIDDVEAYPVVRDGKVIGMVSKFDALRPFAFGTDKIVPHYDEIMGISVQQIMSQDVITVNVDTRLTHVLQTMVQHKVKSIPVLDSDQRLIGVVAREDIFRALQQCRDNHHALPPAPKTAVCRHIA
jgi:CBS domain-containing protein